jgi:hypothetical protein
MTQIKIKMLHYCMFKLLFKPFPELKQIDIAKIRQRSPHELDSDQQLSINLFYLPLELHIDNGQ